jgi:hypothetical protein
VGAIVTDTKMAFLLNDPAKSVQREVLEPGPQIPC